eukprot:c10038_g3_i1.p1 GENE.c10038_g3_i1~~c10038_g3_i1.p1  ORF type:complete len:225 (+),score=61.45 c10038_g3_i1:29-676(+)
MGLDLQNMMQQLVETTPAVSQQATQTPGGMGNMLAQLFGGSSSASQGIAGAGIKASSNISPLGLMAPYFLSPLLREMGKLMPHPDVLGPLSGGSVPSEERRYITQAPAALHWDARLPPPGPLFPMPIREPPPEFVPMMQDPRYKYFYDMAPKQTDGGPKQSKFAPQVMPPSSVSQDFPRSAASAPYPAPFFGDQGDTVSHLRNPASIMFPYPGVY